MIHSKCFRRRWARESYHNNGRLAHRNASYLAGVLLRAVNPGTDSSDDDHRLPRACGIFMEFSTFDFHHVQ
jgi:hypothetical protein